MAEKSQGKQTQADRQKDRQKDRHADRQNFS